MSEITIPAGTSVVNCYKVSNLGDDTLNNVVVTAAYLWFAWLRHGQAPSLHLPRRPRAGYGVHDDHPPRMVPSGVMSRPIRYHPLFGPTGLSTMNTTIFCRPCASGGVTAMPPGAPVAALHTAAR